MSNYRYIVFDTYPLTNASVPPAMPGAVPNHSEQCHQWIRDCEIAGKRILVPAIAYYEGVRDLYRRQATIQIARFQSYCFHPDRYIEFDRQHLTEAGRLWGLLRRNGQATSDPHALDGDAILAAQVLSLSLPAGQYVVVTRNPDHLTRFGLPVDQWENIAP